MAPAGPQTNATLDRASAARQVARSSAAARANQDAVGASAARQVGRSSAAARANRGAMRQVPRSSAAARASPLVVLAVALACAACGPTTTAEPLSDVTVRFVPDGRFFEAPFPAPWRVRADGTVDVTDFPTRSNSLAQRYVDALDAHGEGLSRNAGLWFPLSGAIDPATLPATPEASASFDSAIYLVNVDETSAAHGQLVPLEVQFKAAVETYSPANLLVAIPRQGAVLAPGAWHAAVLTKALRDAQGRRLPRSAQFEDSSARGAQLAAALPRLEAVLATAGRSMDDVVAVTLFRTGDHAGRLDALRTAARAFTGTAPSVVKLRDETDFAVLHAAHLDFVGPALEPEVQAAVLAGGGAEVSAPVSANRGAVTQAVVQHATLSGVDGHYVVFRVPRVKFQAGCWWETAARRGTPVVEAPVDDANAACP